MKYKATLTLDVTADSEQEAISNAWEQLDWGEGTMSVEVVEAGENKEEAFAQFQQAMIAHAKEVNSENYPGDDYYLQDECWRDHFDSGDTPEEAVDSDMSYWDEQDG